MILGGTWESLLGRVRTFIVTVVTIMSIAGCETTSGADITRTATIPDGTAYALAPGDQLKINVFDEPDLSGQFQVDENGNIAFPLVGDIHAGGLSQGEFRLSLIDDLKNGYVRKPRVTVDVLNYRPINIIGEVKNAGQYPYRPGITARDIPAIAGGYTYRANEHTLYISRGLKKRAVTIDLDKDHVSILPGDTIEIPERFF